MYRRKGHPIWVAVQGRAVIPERPELGYIFAFVDVDKRKRSERELRDTLSELQLIFDNTLVGMLYVANDLIVKANAATEQLFGYDARDFSELQIGSLFAAPEQWENVRAAPPTSIEGEVDDVVEGDGAFSFERLMRRADGTTLWCAAYGRPIALEGIATDARVLVVPDTGATPISYLADNTIAGESGSSVVSDPVAPVEPSPNDVDLYTEATDFLDWLKAQALLGATFPTYDELFPDEPPVAASIHVSNPTTFDIQTVETPEYTVPVWDDISAWSGGDITQDATIGPLVAPFEWVENSYTSQFMNGGTNVLYDAIKRDLESSDYGIDALDGWKGPSAEIGHPDLSPKPLAGLQNSERRVRMQPGFQPGTVSPGIAFLE